jgi:integrase
MKRRQRGSGSIFRKGKCKKWVIQFYKSDGTRVREATGEVEWAEAQILLRERLNEVAKDEYTSRSRRTVRIEDLYDALDKRNKIRRPSRPGELAGRWKHLRPVFATKLARELGSEDVNDYILARQAAGAANATINRELSALRRMYRVGMRAHPRKVDRIPDITMLSEKENIRQGFVEYTDFLRLRFAAESEQLWFRTLLELGFAYGWRRSELLRLRVRQLNFKGQTIRLDPGTTKNGEGREVTMTATIDELLRLAVKGKAPDDYVLTRKSGGPVRDFRREWQSVCTRAGLGAILCRACHKPVTARKCECGSRKRKYRGLIVHDLRRSAAKAMRKAGVAESVIMAAGGWRTDAMFRRYAIVSNADQRDAMEKLEADRARMDKLEKAENSPLLSPFIS